MTTFKTNVDSLKKQRVAKGAEETTEEAAARVAAWKAGSKAGRYRNPAVSNETLICAELSLLEPGATTTIPYLSLKTEVDLDALRTIVAQLVTNGHLTESPTEFFHPVTLGEDWSAVPDTL